MFVRVNMYNGCRYADGQTQSIPGGPHQLTEPQSVLINTEKITMIQIQRKEEMYRFEGYRPCIRECPYHVFIEDDKDGVYIMEEDMRKLARVLNP